MVLNGAVAEEYSDVFTLSYIGHDAGVSFMNVKNTKYADGIAFPDDFVTWIQSPDSLFQVVDSKPVLVGGFKGIQINATAACGNTKNWIMLSGTGWGCPRGERMGFIYLDDVNGERVLIQIQASPDGKDYEFIVEESQKVLDTVVFSKPTTFSPKTFSLPVSLSFGSEWKMLEEYSDVFTLKNAEHDTDFAFITPKSIKIAGTVAPYAAVAFPDDFVNWIQSHGLFHITGTQAVNVSGFPATQINATFTAACGPKKDWLFLSGTGWNCRAGEAISFIYLNDVYGQPVLIMTQGSMGLGAVDDFKLGGNATQPVLDTVVFSKP